MQVGWDAQTMLPPSISIHVMVMVGVLLASRSRHYRVIITKVVNTAAAGGSVERVLSAESWQVLAKCEEAVLAFRKLE